MHPEQKAKKAKDTHRGPNDDDNIDWISQPPPQRKLLSHGQNDPSEACLGSKAHGTVLHDLSP